jgi:hypothetical protein
MQKVILVEDAVLRDTFWNAAIDLKKENDELKQRIKRLEEVGDALDARLGCGCMYCGPCRVCQSASENWDEAKEAKP